MPERVCKGVQLLTWHTVTRGRHGLQSRCLTCRSAAAHKSSWLLQLSSKTCTQSAAVCWAVALEHIATQQVWNTFAGLQAGMFSGAIGPMWVAVVVERMRVSCLSGCSLLAPFLNAETGVAYCSCVQRVHC